LEEAVDLSCDITDDDDDDDDDDDGLICFWPAQARKYCTELLGSI
jgi:hypothetical protein